MVLVNRWIPLQHDTLIRALWGVQYKHITKYTLHDCSDNSGVFQFSSCSSDSALCLPGASSDSEDSQGLQRESKQLQDKTEEVFTSESENSSVATTRTVRRVDPATGEMTAGSPSASLSFGSNLSLTVSEGERDKPTKLSTPVRGFIYCSCGKDKSDIGLKSKHLNSNHLKRFQNFQYQK